jgi:hypothetical protein
MFFQPVDLAGGIWNGCAGFPDGELDDLHRGVDSTGQHNNSGRIVVGRRERPNRAELSEFGFDS